MHYSLAQIPLQVYLGVPEEERATKQEILVYTSFSFDSSKAQKDDQFEGLIDYDQIRQSLESFPGDRKFITLEYLYRELLTHLQVKFPTA
ncbi:MAG TPA: dihydroneopterin aldolase, partial [Candidatus Gracilibacteria bacterium]